MTQFQKGIYNIINIASQRFLDSKDCDQADSSLCCTQNGSDEGTRTQQWRLVFLEGTPVCKIQSVPSRLFCGVKEDKPFEGAPIWLTTAQTIFYIEASSSNFHIRIPYRDLLLTYSGGNLHLTRANGSPEQLWDLQYFGLLHSGTYNIINAIQRRALDLCDWAIIGYPLNRPHGTDNQKWELQFLKGTSFCTMQAVNSGLFCGTKGDVVSAGSEAVGRKKPTVVSFTSIGNGYFSITIPYQNLALSINSRQGIDLFEKHPVLYYCPYDGADGQLWILELIDPPSNSDQPGTQSS